MVGPVVDGDRRGRAGNGPAVSALDQLAGRMGIEPEFKDATGRFVLADPKVSRTLLDAMGLAVEKPADATGHAFGTGARGGGAARFRP